MATADALYLTGRATRAQREREAVRRLGISWLAMVGWNEGPLLVVSCAHARLAKHEREQCRRVELMVGCVGAGPIAQWCVAGERETAALRRAVVDAMQPYRVANDLFAVDSGFAASQVEAALALLASPVLSDSGLAAAVDREMIGGWP